MTLIDSIARLCTKAERLGSEADQRELRSIQTRLSEPLRVAIAGRIKAGKSTLLNALVGERLAPTGAGECTQIVTWYRHGMAYEVAAYLPSGERRPVGFDRSDGRLTVHLDDLAPSDIDRLEVCWPTEKLSGLTLIDTPGLEGMDDEAADRTRRLLGLDGEEEHSEVDAVIYLMRHLHRHDAEFLEAFFDRSLSHPSPVNALAVLSRADEIGAGRRDALDSAAAIADRYGADERVRALCATVVPVAALIAETGFTLREHEVESLRTLAGLASDEAEALLLSADHFVDPTISPLSPETRHDLLLRLGMFGARFTISLLTDDGAVSAASLSASLIDASGVDDLKTLLQDHFERRSQLLKARSALANLKAIVTRMSSEGEPVAELLGSIERLEMSAQELSYLRLLHLVLSGSVPMSDAEADEMTRLISDADTATRLGVASEDPEVQKVEALAGIERWRAKGTHLLAERSLAEACEIVTRCYEGIHAALSAET